MVRLLLLLAAVSACPAFAAPGIQNGQVSSLISQSTTNPADSGVVRLGNAETVCWETISGTDICSAVNANDVLTLGAYNGVIVSPTGPGLLYGSAGAGEGFNIEANYTGGAGIALGGDASTGGVGLNAMSSGFIDFYRDGGGAAITRWQDGATVFNVSLQTPTPLAASVALTLPPTVPTTTGQPLIATTGGVMSFAPSATFTSTGETLTSSVAVPDSTPVLRGLGLDWGGGTISGTAGIPQTVLYVLELLPSGLTLGDDGATEPIRWDSTVTFSGTGSAGPIVTIGDVPTITNSASGTYGTFIGKTYRPTFRAATGLTFTGTTTYGEFVTPNFNFPVISGGTGTMSAAEGLYFQPFSGDGWTITNTRGLHVANWSDNGNSTIAAQGGVDIDSLTGATLNYSLRSTGAQVMLHEGFIRIGDTTTPTHQLEVKGSVAGGATNAIAQMVPSGTISGTATVTHGIEDTTGYTIGGTLNLYTSFGATGTVTDTTGNSFTLVRNKVVVNRTTGGTAISGTAFDNGPTWQVAADIDTTTGTQIGFRHAPIYAVTGGGTPTITGVTDTAFEVAALTVGASTTVATQRGLHVTNGSGSGAITTTEAISIDDLTKATTNISLKSLGASVTMRHVGSAVFGANAAPGARLEAQEPTVGNEVFRIDSVATNDDPTEQVFQCRVATTDATATDCKTVGVASTKVRTMEATVVAHCTGGASCTANNGASFTLIGTCKNNAGTTGAVAGSPDIISTTEDVAAWDATIDCDDTGDTIRLRVTGAATTNITWHATIRTMEVGT